MTYPEIGNYGVNPEKMNPTNHMSGFVVRELSPVVALASSESLDAYLKVNASRALKA